MVVSSKLLAVVTPTHEVSLTASVSVIETSIPRSVTVSLSLTTGLLGSTTPPPVVVAAPTSLTRGRSKRSSGHDDRGCGFRKVLGQVTAVVLRVVVGSELLTVVAPAHEVSLEHRLETRSRIVGHWYLASSVSVIDSAVKRPVTVTLSKTTGLLGCTAPLAVEIPAPASLP